MYFQKNFVYLSRSAEFLEMAFDDLIFFLKRDTLYVDDEKQVSITHRLIKKLKHQFFSDIRNCLSMDRVWYWKKAVWSEVWDIQRLIILILPRK